MPCCGDCGKGFGSGGCSGTHSDRWEGSCSDTFKYNCNDCMEVFNTKNRRTSHMNKGHTGAKCQNCDKPFYDQQRRDQHAKDSLHDGLKSTKPGEPKLSNKKPQLELKSITPKSNANAKASCGGCNKQFTDGMRRDQHMRDTGHTGPSLANKAIDQSSGSKSSPNDIVSQRSTANQSAKAPDTLGKFPCSDCNRQFENPLQRNQHASDKSHQTPEIPPGQDQYKDYDINSRARVYHDNNARPPKDRNKDQDFAAFNSVTNTLRDEMKKQGIATQKYCVGSTYERTNIHKKSDYDVIISLRDPNITVSKLDKAPPGYAGLQKDGKDLSAAAHMDQRKGEIQKILNKTDFGNYSVKIRQHGPALQLDVTDKTTKSLIPIDVVPGYELTDGSMYVAKVPKAHQMDGDASNSAGHREMFWHKSNSFQAREKFLTIDLGNKCHREAYRTCKAIRNREPNLHHITSFQLKSSLFALSNKNCGSWTRGKLGDRVKDIFHHVSDQYKSGTLPDYFTPEINLISQTDEATRTNTINRLDYLARNPEKLFTINEA